MTQKLFVIYFLYINGIVALQNGITVAIGSSKIECFYHEVKETETITIDYQVINGGDMDITFTLSDPKGYVIINDIQLSQNTHRHEAQLSGDYCMCFNSGFGTFTARTVYFNIIIERDGVQNFDDIQWNERPEGLSPEEYYVIKVKDITKYVDRIRASLTKAQNIQEKLHTIEARDRNVAENNFSKVNAWSAFQTFVMLLVGLLQVYMLRSIFETDSRVNRFLRKVPF